MTVIAYRAGVMACDALWSDNGRVFTKQTKIKRLPSGALCGGAGDGDDRELLALLESVTTHEQLPTRKKLAKVRGELQALLVLPDGSVWQVDAGKESDYAGVTQIQSDFAAIGSGDTFALGAMAAGASAARAVEVTCALSTQCAEPIFTLNLKDHA